MKEFVFYFRIALGQLIHWHTDMLNLTLQKCNVSRKSPGSSQNDHFYLDEHWRLCIICCFLAKSDRICYKVRYEGARVLRKWKVTRRFDHELAPPEFSSCVEDHFGQIYFEALDNMIQEGLWIILTSWAMQLTAILSSF